MNILLTNDDGIDAPGIRTLADILRPNHDVILAAPHRERSASSRSITLHRPIFYHRRTSREAAVEGTPVDCVSLAMSGLFPPTRFDLIVSGINNSPNLGDDVSYSGTVGAALEADKYGLPGIAVSCAAYTSSPRYEDLAHATAAAINLLDDHGLLAPRHIFNLNIPNQAYDTLTGYEFTSLGKRVYVDKLDLRESPNGHAYAWLDGKMNHKSLPGDDFDAVERGAVSITPIQVHCNNFELLRDIRERFSQQPSHNASLSKHTEQSAT